MGAPPEGLPWLSSRRLGRTTRGDEGWGVVRLMARWRTYDVIINREALGIDEKPRKRRRKGRRRSLLLPRARLLSAGLLLALLVILGYLFTAPRFTVRGATVRGNRLVDAAAIFRASGLQGKNVFRVNTTAAARAVEQLPYVKRAQVWVRLPADVGIVVEEYTPKWVWVRGNDRFWIDEVGNVLPYGGELEGSITVVDRSGQPLRAGARLDGTLVETLQALQYLMPELSQVEYDPVVGLIVEAGPGWPVRIGHTSEHLAAKVTILEGLVAELSRRGADVAFIDLRFPERPYYRLK